MENFQAAAIAQQRAQNHDAPFFRQKRHHRRVQSGDDVISQSLERQYLQTRIARQAIVAQKLSFQLKGGLFRREQDQTSAFRRSAQSRANLLQALKSFSRSGRTKKKARLHASFVAY